MATPDALPAGRADARPAMRRSRRRWLEIGLFLAPALILYVVFLIVPVVQAVHYSVYAWNGLGPLTDFVGLDNYREAFGDPGFREAMQHNGILVALSVLLQLPLALAVALLLNRPLRGRSLLRLLFFMPYVLSEAITAVIFLQILQPDGFVDGLLQSVGLGGLVQLWLADLGTRLLHALRRDHLEVHRLLDPPLPRRPPGRAERAPRGRRDGRRVELGDASVRDAAAARDRRSGSPPSSPSSARSSSSTSSGS